eukprot:1207822-Prymnesium_polylepis.1
MVATAKPRDPSQAQATLPIHTAALARATRTAHDDYLLDLSSSCTPRARGTAEPRSARGPPYGAP